MPDHRHVEFHVAPKISYSAVTPEGSESATHRRIELHDAYAEDGATALLTLIVPLETLAHEAFDAPSTPPAPTEFPKLRG